MLRFFVVVFLFFSTLSITQAEEIKNFSVEYTINDDASVLVEETIVYDFQNEYKHGIFRIIGKNHPQPASVWYKERYLDIDAIGVTKNGISEPFKFYEQNSSVEFKVGDPDKTITGQNIYKITYKLTGALSYGDNGAEFYWNVTGNEWPVPISNVTAVVRSKTKGIITSEVYCYQGYFGVNSPCTNYNTNEYGANFKEDSLLVGEGLTIAVGVDQVKVAYVVTEKMSSFSVVSIVFTFWLLFFGYRVYRFRNEFKVRQLPVVAQYEPYADFLPMETGVLLDNKLDSRDVAAGILYLAEKGFIIIRKIESKIFLFIPVSDYEVILRRPFAELFEQPLQDLLKMFFNENDDVGRVVTMSRISDRKSTNYFLIKTLEKNIKSDLAKNGFVVYNFSFLFLGYFIISLFLLLLILSQPDIKIWGTFLLISLTLATLIIFYLAIKPRRTAKGEEVVNHMLGFKLFLSITDKERFGFHNAPERNPELFMKYLPYAIALGVEEKWVEVFDDITLPPPKWYDGRDYDNFSAKTFSKDIAVFSKVIAGSIKSQSYSGLSGSSGRGFSGGGGGRGGGGSW